ncbi:MAG: hypothetical protein AB8G99_06755 [Planctomycetaceae bacterium]
MSGLEKYQLNKSFLTYVAFRVAALHTFELLSGKRPAFEDDDYGYLSELPLIREVAPQVQLELLADTWKKGCDSKLYPPTIIDECVLHCAFERSVELVLSQPITAKRLMSGGSRDMSGVNLSWLPVRLRTLQLTLPLPTAIDAAQVADSVVSGPVPGYNGVPVGPTPRDQLFEVLGRWRVNRNLAWGFDGLLTTSEILEITRFLHSGCAI